ncbi:hypothetical protein ACTLR6_002674 [Escherichia coli]|nr:hypothetical protein [Escherichia coli]MDZ6792082.1 hypothetical protein [Escherichia coli]
MLRNMARRLDYKIMR